MERARSLLVAGAVAAAVLVAAPRAQAFVISFGSTGAATGDHALFIARLVEAFRKDYPKAQVELRSSTSYLQTIIEAVMDSAQAPPDVGVAGVVDWPVVAHKSVLHPFTEVLSPSELATIHKRVRPMVDVQFYGKGIDSKPIAIPFNRAHPVLFVNDRLLPGLKAISPSWDDLEQVVLEARAAAPASSRDRLRIAIPTDDWISEYILTNARGKSVQQGMSVELTDKKTIAVVSRLRQLIADGVVYAVATQHDAYVDFMDGQSAGALVTISTFGSVASRKRFPFHITYPPKVSESVYLVSGGDLVLPGAVARLRDPAVKRDIHDFIQWFYLGRGAGLWASMTGYLPVTAQATRDSSYAALAAEHVGSREIFANSEHWTSKGIYNLDEPCNILKLRGALEAAFKAAIDTKKELLEALRAGEANANDVLKRPCGP